MKQAIDRDILGALIAMHSRVKAPAVWRTVEDATKQIQCYLPRFQEIAAKSKEHRQAVIYGIESWPREHEHWPAEHELAQHVTQYCPVPKQEELPKLEKPTRDKQEAYAATVMRSALGQEAIAQGWAGLLWRFVVEKGRAPIAAEQGQLRHERLMFDDALAECDKDWPPALPNIGPFRSIGNCIGGRQAFKRLGLAILEREHELAEMYRQSHAS